VCQRAIILNQKERLKNLPADPYLYRVLVAFAYDTLKFDVIIIVT